MVPPDGLPSPAVSLGYVILVLAIYVLACARVTRLINLDELTDPLRLWIAARAETALAVVEESELAGQHTRAEIYGRKKHRWLVAYRFAGCPWCVGFWVSLAAAAVPVAVIGWPGWTVLPVAFASSHLIGVAAPLTADEDIEIVKG